MEKPSRKNSNLQRMEQSNANLQEPILIGLCGQSCSGKNEAADFLKERSFFCIDADKISDKVFAENSNEILRIFLPIAKARSFNILAKSNSEIEKKANASLPLQSIDKRQFAMLVFSDAELLKQHENFILPKIEERINEEIFKAFKTEPLKPIILNAPTLHKTSLAKKCKLILYIKSPYILRVLRAKKRDKIPLKNILARFSKQKDFFSQYLFLNADTVIVRNFVSLSKFKKRILARLKERNLY